jgi:hypothetical protein
VQTHRGKKLFPLGTLKQNKLKELHPESGVFCILAKASKKHKVVERSRNHLVFKLKQTTDYQ